MDQMIAQSELSLLYTKWKETLQFSKEQAETLSPPLLLHITEGYWHAEKRILVLGKETFGWEWTSELRTKYPAYPHDWRFQDIESMQDFLSNEDAVDGLCWGYQAFDFAKYQPDTYRSPFWQAFREVQTWSNAAVMWGNVVRCDYECGSILHASDELRKKLLEQQKSLFLEELAILEPHICLFFSGPDYDPLISGMLPKCEFLPCNDQEVGHLARLAHPVLPTASFRTYHPNYLRRKKWDYIEALRNLAYANE